MNSILHKFGLIILVYIHMYKVQQSLNLFVSIQFYNIICTRTFCICGFVRAYTASLAVVASLASLCGIFAAAIVHLWTKRSNTCASCLTSPLVHKYFKVIYILTYAHMLVSASLQMNALERTLKHNNCNLYAAIHFTVFRLQMTNVGGFKTSVSIKATEFTRPHISCLPFCIMVVQRF